MQKLIVAALLALLPSMAGAATVRLDFSGHCEPIRIDPPFGTACSSHGMKDEQPGAWTGWAEVDVSGWAAGQEMDFGSLLGFSFIAPTFTIEAEPVSVFDVGYWGDTFGTFSLSIASTEWGGGISSLWGGSLSLYERGIYLASSGVNQQPQILAAPLPPAALLLIGGLGLVGWVARRHRPEAP